MTVVLCQVCNVYLVLQIPLKISTVPVETNSIAQLVWISIKYLTRVLYFYLFPLHISFFPQTQLSDSAKLDG
jgi:hypothetical protein